MYEKQEFKDRQSYYPNRRKITILEQNANEMIANIELIAEDIKEEGTALNAQLMQKFQDSIIQSEKDSGNALQIANEAKTKSQEAYDHSVESFGTKVSKNGEFVAQFNADEKTDRTQFDELTQTVDVLQQKVNTLTQKVDLLEQRIEALENNPKITKIQYDATTSTFVI